MVARHTTGTSPAHPAEDQPGRGRAVMVVDDDRVIVALLRHILERRGYDVSLASDGREATDRLHGQPPGPVLLDVVLPYLNGYELIRQIRAAPGRAEVPIIMLRVKSQERNVVRALDAGTDDYMVKPFKPEDLAARVWRFLP